FLWSFKLPNTCCCEQFPKIMNLVIGLLFSISISLVMTKDPTTMLGNPAERSMLLERLSASRSLCAHGTDSRDDCITTRNRKTPKEQLLSLRHDTIALERWLGIQ
ncbi:unnamed protein product, partial [Allacma fusca]